ncbi:RNase H domain-containing protein [Trichonephila clavipes]|nr:RNase H domain-containing protein [Trichonephila clavipes]
MNRNFFTNYNAHTQVKDPGLGAAYDPCLIPCYQDLKISIHPTWQETWDPQVINKVHSIHLSTAHWAAVPVRRHDVRLTRLRIGHTRLTLRHLLLGRSPPVCDFCQWDLSLLHILIECLKYSSKRNIFFKTNLLTLTDFVGKTPHPQAFLAFLHSIDVLHET